MIVNTGIQQPTCVCDCFVPVVTDALERSEGIVALTVSRTASSRDAFVYVRVAIGTGEARVRAVQTSSSIGAIRCAALADFRTVDAPPARITRIAESIFA